MRRLSTILGRIEEAIEALERRPEFSPRVLPGPWLDALPSDVRLQAEEKLLPEGVVAGSEAYARWLQQPISIECIVKALPADFRERVRKALAESAGN